MVAGRGSRAAAGRGPIRGGAAGPSLGPVLDFIRLLWEVDHGLNSRSKRMRMRFGVTGPQRFAVRIVSRFPGISAGELAALLHVHPSTLTGVLERLVRRGLISRRADPRDARRALLWATASGRRVDRLRGGTIEAGVRSALARLTPGELAAARHALETLAGALESADRLSARPAPRR
jgi:DNA-binding MarR family transcriptional regulator